MPLEQTITIVNSSGKIIGTGKQLVSIFKEAKASYQSKKAQIKADRSIQRAQTFGPQSTRQPTRRDDYPYDEDDDYEYGYGKDFVRGGNYEYAPRRSFDAHSEASSKMTRRSKSTTRHGRRNEARSRPTLTEYNLKTNSEVCSTAPSKVSRPPVTYRSPYAETLPRGMVSRMDLPQMDSRTRVGPMDNRRRSMSIVDVPRDLKVKEIDMDLAYGNIPPDLEDRVDLDPVYQAQHKESTAQALVRKVEGLLDEAHCVQHSAGAIIGHLQENPDAAAAVALTLAELSTIVSKMSPAFLTMLKGGSPAVFGLLASPHFLIGTGIAVGVTIVMFGGWKIVKRVKETQAAREALAFEAVPPNRPAPLRTQSEYAPNGCDEAIILDDDLSSIDSWRRGIMPWADDESADVELITPEALTAQRLKHRKDDDVQSRRSTRTARTAKSTKSTKSKTTKKDKEREAPAKAPSKVPERKSSRLAATAESVADTERTRSKKSATTERKHKTPLLLEDGKSRRGEDEELELALRPGRRGGDTNMLKALFKRKEGGKSRSSLVLA